MNNQNIKYKSLTILISIIVICSLPISAQQIKDSSIIVASCYVLFDSDKSDIKNEDSLKLSFLIDTSASIKNAFWKISAHTDDVGSLLYNQELSLKRTDAVINFLIRKDIDSTLISSSHHGELEPRSENKNDDGKQQNRRAKIEIVRPVKLIALNGKIVDDETGSALNESAVVLRSKILKDTMVTNQAGIFQLNGPIASVIGLDVSKESYLSKSTMLKTDPSILKDTIVIRMSKFKVGRVISFNKLHFYGSKAILLPKSNPELSRLLKIMTDNASTCVEIVGHVNYPNRPVVAKNTFEYNLSVARSKSIYTFLIQKGIDEKRMFYTGRGNSKMIYPHTRRESEMQINRRVEIHVKECEVVLKSDNEILDDVQYNFY